MCNFATKLLNFVACLTWALTPVMSGIVQCVRTGRNTMRDSTVKKVKLVGCPSHIIIPHVVVPFDSKPLPQTELINSIVAGDGLLHNRPHSRKNWWLICPSRNWRYHSKLTHRHTDIQGSWTWKFHTLCFSTCSKLNTRLRQFEVSCMHKLTNSRSNVHK